MTSTARLIGGPLNGQTMILDNTQVNYVNSDEPEDTTSQRLYVYKGTDPETGEHLFEWGTP